MLSLHRFSAAQELGEGRQSPVRGWLAAERFPNRDASDTSRPAMRVPENNPERLRILYVIATLDRAGAEGQLTALLARLDRSRFDPYLVCLTRGGPHEAALQEAGVPYEILGKRWKLDPGPVWRLWRLARHFRPHVLHTWMFTANAFGRAAGILAGVPIRVAGERAVDTWKTGPYWLTDRILAAWTDRIVANCTAIKDFVSEKVSLSEEKIGVIPNGVEFQRFAVREHRDEGDVVFCSIGRLTRQKRMDLFIRAMAGLREEGLAAKGRIVGEGPLKSELEELIGKLGLEDAVELRAPTDDVPGMLAESDILVLASDWEGMPNVVLEAMSAGLPVVATAVDGSRELVVEGVTGLLTEPGNPTALAAAMSRLAGSVELRQQFGQAGRRRVEEEFSMERMVERYQELYLRLAEKKGLSRV